MLNIDDLLKQVQRTVLDAFHNHPANPLTLGDFRDRLEEFPANAAVEFDFGGLDPTYFMSYRGYYDHVALGFTGDWRADTTRCENVGQLLAKANQAIGATFEGYKGGDFVMAEDSPLWVANWGHTSSTVITGFDALESHDKTEIYKVIIKTTSIEI